MSVHFQPNIGLIVSPEGACFWQAAALRRIEDAGIGRVIGVVTAEPSPRNWRQSLTRSVPALRPAPGLPVPVPFVSAQELFARCNLIIDLSEEWSGRSLAERDGIECWVLADAGGRPPIAAAFESFLSGSGPVEIALIPVGADRPPIFLGAVAMRHGLAGSVDSLMTALADWPSCGLNRMARSGATMEDFGAPVSYASGRLWPFRLVWAYVRSTLAYVRSLFSVEIWNIGIGPAASNPMCVDWSAIRWFPESGKERFRADPFPLASADGLRILFEDWRYAVGKGEIWCAEMGADGQLVSERPILSTSNHLSYPFPVAEGSCLIILPESAETGVGWEVALDAADLQHRDAPIQILNEPLVDPTVFPHDGKWWLFATLAGRNSALALFVWHGPTSHGPWTPHALNPVKCDVRSSRPAGAPFRADGKLIRPAQDCSRRYGGAVIFNEITTLTPDDFSERVIGRLDPDFGGRYPAGTHTFNIIDDGGQKQIVLDAKRLALRWDGPLLQRRLRRQAAGRNQKKQSFD